MTTTPASGAADLPEALRRSTAADGKTELFNLPGYPLMVRAVDFNRIHTESEMRRTALLDEMQKAALAAGQAPAAQAVVQDDLITLRKPTTSAELLWLLKLAHLVISDVDKTLEETFAPAQPAAQQGAAYAALPEKYYLAGGEVPTWDAKQMHAFADATHALRASRGQAPAGATLPECLTCSDHGAVGNILTAEPCPDCTRWNVQPAQARAADSVTAPVPPPECETEAEKRAFAFGWFKALEAERMKADNKKKDPL